MPNADGGQGNAPDYVALVRYLVEPLLDKPEILKLSCELARSQERALIRIAFDTAEQGRVVGRGGRNIDAMRTVLDATARSAGQTARLEVFDLHRSERGSDRDHRGERRGGGDRPRNKRSRPTKPPVPRKRES